MAIYSGFTQLENGEFFHSYVKLPEGTWFHKCMDIFYIHGFTLYLMNIFYVLNTWFSQMISKFRIDFLAHSGLSRSFGSMTVQYVLGVKYLLRKFLKP